MSGLLACGAPKRKQGRQGGEGADTEACKLTLAQAHARTHTHSGTCPPSNPSDVACSISVGRRQTRANGHTVEFGDDGVLTAVPRIVIGTPDGGKTRHRGGGLKIQRGGGG